MLDTEWLGGLLDALDGGSRTDSHLTRRPHNSRDVGWFSEKPLAWLHTSHCTTWCVAAGLARWRR